MVSAAISIALFGGCGDAELVHTVSFRLVGPPAPLADGTCPDAGGPSPLSLPGDASPARLRLTYRVTETRALACDAMLAIDDGALPIVAVPDPSPAQVDVHVELFAGDGALLASGTRDAVSLAAGGDVEITLLPRDRTSCPPVRPREARAFHTATRLPTGEVLLAGGVLARRAGEPIDFAVAGGGFYVTDSLELYDPRTGVATAIAASGVTARAMHAAYLLDDDGSAAVRVALVGGVTVPGDPTAAPALATGLPGLPFALAPTPLARTAPAEILILDLSAATATVTSVAENPPRARVLPAASVPDRDAPILAGGWSNDDRLAAIATIETLDPRTGARVAETNLAVARFGASVTRLADGRALVWGGNLGSASEPGDAAEVLATPAGEPASSTPLVINPLADPPEPRALHTALRVADGSVIVAGGFAIADNADATRPATTLVQHLVVDGDVVTVIDARGDAAGAPAGFARATPLPDDTVVISGGTPCVAGSPILCSERALYRYDPETQTVTRLPAGLMMPRYGHAQLALDAGHVLITGGLDGDGSTLRVLADAEIFNGWTERDDALADLDITRAPGDIARHPDGTPVAACALFGP